MTAAEEFCQGAEAYRKAHPEQRVGQAYMNYLWQFRPEFYNRIHDHHPGADPFYNDDHFVWFILEVMDMFKEEVADGPRP